MTFLSLPLLEAQPGCKLCPRWEGAQQPGIPTERIAESLPPNENSDAVVFLGMNPGSREDREGRPFVGPSGKILRKAFIEGAGLPPLATIYLANAARCWTPLSDQPKAKEFKICMTAYFVKDLATIQATHTRRPVHVVCLGGEALAALSSLTTRGKVSLTTAFLNQGQTTSLGEGGVPFRLWATYHPAAMLYNPSLIHAATGHYSLLRSYLDGMPPLPTKVHRVPPMDPIRKDRTDV